MVNCDYCQREIQKLGACPDCGTTMYTAGGKIIYGATAKDISGCEVAITEKYLIIRRVSKAESTGSVLGNAGGLLGAVITDAVRSSIVRPHGFYPLRNIRKGIFPYCADGIKKKNAIKLINHDGTDFILIFDKPGFVDGTAKVLKKMVEHIRAAIPVVEDGSGVHFGAACCVHPFVTRDNFDQIRPGYRAGAANRAGNGYGAASAAPAAAQPAARQAQATRPVQADSRPIQQQMVPSVSAASKIRCNRCGTYVMAGSKFCTECGSPIMVEPQRRKCLRCGELLGAGDKFCGHCGYQAK